MKTLKHLKRLVVAGAGLFSAIAIVPLTLAAPPKFNTVDISPAGPYYVEIPGKPTIMTVEYNFLTGGPSTAPVFEQIIDSKTGVAVYNFGNLGADDRASGNIKLTWDGIANTGGDSGKSVPNGSYHLYLSSQTEVGKDTYTGPDFTIRTASAPTITLTNPSPTTYNSQSGQDFELTYELKAGSGLGEPTVYLYVNGPAGNNAVLNTITQLDQKSGTYTIKWNGKNNGQAAAAGSYQYALQAVAKQGSSEMKSTAIINNFTVTNEAPQPQPSPKCAGYTDVAQTDINCDAIVYAKSIGAITGNPDGTFNPSGLLQRDQVAKIVLETFGLFNKQQDYCGGSNPFPDVSESSWAFQYICRGKALNIITGYKAGVDAGFYRLGRSVNRAEFLALVLRNVKDQMPSNDSTSYNDVAAGQWFSGYAKYSQSLGLFSGSNLYPTNFVSRVEVADVIYKLHQAGKI